MALCKIMLLLTTFSTSGFLHSMGPVEGKSCETVCGVGQYLVTELSCECLLCPNGFYMDMERHQMKDCYPCREPNAFAKQEVKERCTPTADTVLGCILGYFVEDYDHGSPMCTRCTECRYNTDDLVHEGKACDGREDTLCCPRPNMAASLDENGSVKCVPDYNKLYCGQGEYMDMSRDWPSCLPCQDGYFMTKDEHQDRSCYRCSEASAPDEKVSKPCTKTTDTEIVCLDGYYMTLKVSEREPNIVDRKCVSCSDCTFQGKYVGRACSTYKDTVCCPKSNMDVKKEGDWFVCVDTEKPIKEAPSAGNEKTDEPSLTRDETTTSDATRGAKVTPTSTPTTTQFHPNKQIGAEYQHQFGIEHLLMIVVFVVALLYCTCLYRINYYSNHSNQPSNNAGDEPNRLNQMELQDTGQCTSNQNPNLTVRTVYQRRNLRGETL